MLCIHSTLDVKLIPAVDHVVSATLNIFFRVPKYVIIIENVNVLQGVIVRDLEFKPRLLTHHN